MKNPTEEKCPIDGCFLKVENWGWPHIRYTCSNPKCSFVKVISKTNGTII